MTEEGKLWTSTRTSVARALALDQTRKVETHLARGTFLIRNKVANLHRCKRVAIAGRGSL